MRGSFRDLTFDEVSFVAGGDGGDEPDIVVHGRRLTADQNYVDIGSLFWGGGGGGGYYGSFGGDGSSGGSDQYRVWQLVPSATDENGDIVVEHPPMTDAQKAAYDAAVARAGYDLHVVELFGVGALAYLGTAGATGTIGAALAGYEIGTNLSHDQLLKGLAAEYYGLDGLDGSYDGYNELDRQSPIDRYYPGY